MNKQILIASIVLAVALTWMKVAGYHFLAKSEYSCSAITVSVKDGQGICSQYSKNGVTIPPAGQVYRSNEVF